MVDVAEKWDWFFIQKNKLSNEEIDKFNFVAKQILKDGYFDNTKHKGYLELVSRFTETEILFYDPVKNRTTANSQVYVKALAKIIEP